MAWEIEFTDEFSEWWDRMTADEQKSIARYVGLLEQAGPDLCRPYADTIRGSRVSNLRELRVQHEGRPYRVLYVFDPRRTGILLIGGDKTGNPRWYDEYIPKAESLYEQHLREIKKQ
ncbi:MAG: type II toxin-antitoxin system RelE/ParE family toxin [Terracidiphilus sp.]|jgi:hypothetical protein